MIPSSHHLCLTFRRSGESEVVVNELSPTHDEDGQLALRQILLCMNGARNESRGGQG